ncbi:MAG: hypothetical protein QOJ72_1014 [Nocardioidaceae bacterium]|jgi:hypothetical protein|nr:hypothetical protein [Nocardioidaceae bacterium]
MLALAVVKCQSSEVGSIGVNDDGVVFVADDELGAVLYEPRRVTLPDGTTIAHESQGGTLSSVAAIDHGEFFLEIAYLGDGPVGGELVMTASVPGRQVASYVHLGDLWADDVPEHVPESWPAAVDLAIGLLGPEALPVVGGNVITKDDVEQFHQRLLGVLYA